MESPFEWVILFVKHGMSLNRNWELSNGSQVPVPGEFLLSRPVVLFQGGHEVKTEVLTREFYGEDNLSEQVWGLVVEGGPHNHMEVDAFEACRRSYAKQTEEV